MADVSPSGAAAAEAEGATPEVANLEPEAPAAATSDTQQVDTVAGAQADAKPEQPEEDDTEEEEGDGDSEDDAVVNELTQQVALLGSSDESDDEELDERHATGGEEAASCFELLDDEAVIRIFSYLSLEDLVTASEVSCKWNLLAKYDSLWQRMYESANWQHPFPSPPSGLSWYELFVQRVKNEIECVMAEAMEDEEMEEAEDAETAEQFNKNFLDVFSQAAYQGRDYRSEVDVLLDKGGFAMEELLNLDDFVNDLRAGKDRLLVYLVSPEAIKGLLNIALVEPSDCAEDDRRRLQQLPHIAFQTLASDPLVEQFIQNHDLLDTLFSYLDAKDGALSRSKSGYFAKITEVLFEKYPTELVAFFRTRDEITTYFVGNADDNFLMELLFKLVDCGITHQWLHDADLIPQLVALLDVDSPQDVQENATQVLVNVFTLCQPWTQSVLVIDIFNNEAVAENLMRYIKSEPVTGFKIKQGLSVLIAVLNLITEDLIEVPLIITHIMENLDFFAGILRDPLLLGDMQSIATTVQFLDPPFGSVRLGILELFVALLYTGYPVVVAEMEQHNVFTILLDLFFAYKWNNIVHHQITQIFSGLLCGNDDDMMRTVLEKCGLVGRIVTAFFAEEQDKVGYMGHLRELANELLKVTKYSAPVALLLEGDDQWMEFALGRLPEINEVEDTPLGGVVARSLTDEEDYYDMDGYDEYEEYEEGDAYGAYEEGASDEDEYEEYEVVDDYSSEAAYDDQYAEEEEEEEEEE